MCTPAAIVALNPHNRLSIFHKYGTTFHSPDSALGRRSLQDIPEASAPPHASHPVPTRFVIIVNSENGEEKAAKVLKASATTARTKGSHLRKKQEHRLKLLPMALYGLDYAECHCCS
jgi:hypothetical protein